MAQRKARFLPAMRPPCPFEAELDRIANDQLYGYATAAQAKEEAAEVRRAQREARAKERVR